MYLLSRVRRLRCDAAPEIGRLLCLLLVRICALSTKAGYAFLLRRSARSLKVENFNLLLGWKIVCGGLHRQIAGTISTETSVRRPGELAGVCGVIHIFTGRIPPADPNLPVANGQLWTDLAMRSSVLQPWLTMVTLSGLTPLGCNARKAS